MEEIRSGFVRIIYYDGDMVESRRSGMGAMEKARKQSFP